MPWSLEQWLAHQSQVHPQTIDLGLDRLRQVVDEVLQLFQQQAAIDLLGHAVHHRQSQPGAFADTLGGEERFGGFRQCVGVHAFAMVADRQAQVIAGRQIGRVRAPRTCREQEQIRHARLDER